MPKADAFRWNERYKKANGEWYTKPSSFLTEQFQSIGTPGIAVDIAMGMGANAGFLVSKGWNVIGLDISAEAVFRAKSSWPGIQAAVIDLDQLRLPANFFDLILNMYYLDRQLWPVYRQALKPGGFLVMETLLSDMLGFDQQINPGYLLEHDELRLAFQDWEVVLYREGWVKSDHGNEKAVASLIVRKPQIS
jgi:tellurite methyltransferase